MFQIHNSRKQDELSQLHAKLTNTLVVAKAIFFVALAISVLVIAGKI